MTLSAADIQVGKTYRAKRPVKSWERIINDRYVLYVSKSREFVQYDSETVRDGRQYPKISMEKFLKWAASEVILMDDVGEVKR